MIEVVFFAGRILGDNPELLAISAFSPGRAVVDPPLSMLPLSILLGVDQENSNLTDIPRSPG
jgi:hypothetical protein